LSKTGNALNFTAGTPEGFRIYHLDIATDGALGKVRQIYAGKGMAWVSSLSTTGDIVAFTSTERTGTLQSDVLVLETSSGKLIGKLEDEAGGNLVPVMFSPMGGDTRLLATTDESGVTRPFLWDTRTGERSTLAIVELPGEVDVLDWSADGERLLLCQFAQAVQHLYVYHLSQQTLKKLEHPSGTYMAYNGVGTYFMTSGEIFAQWQDSTHPSQVIALDGENGRQTRTVLAAGEVPAGRPMQSVSFASTDGEIIQGWLALPEGQGPFPIILDTHGGPTSVMTEYYLPGCQAWLELGFAFLSINYRGSTTFGREFERKIWGNLGYWEVEDMVAARNWLVEQGIAIPEQILLTGWSYGGYLTLLGLGKHPNLWRGGMAGVAIADWTVQYEDTSDTLRSYQVSLFEGTPEEKPEVYKSSSPITYAEQVAAPVLIIQGRNDTRTPARPITMYEARLKELGKDIEVIWFDSGHIGAGSQVERSIEHQEWMMRFALRILA
jgi:dipeptidyl aminopeptidase/acylaminoacyl peptidase